MTATVTRLELVDIGVNLTHRSFSSDRDAVLSRAHAAGVRRLVVTGTSLAHSREAQALCRRHLGVLYSTAGVHPHDASHYDDATRAGLLQLLAHDEVVAVGECGLDFNRNYSPRPVQEKVFAAQLELAITVKKPLFLHERDAHPTLIAILDRFADGSGRLPVPAVVHCYTGGARALDDYLSRGFYIGITGWICDERRGRELQELVKRIPLERLMLETDAPFLMPRDLKPKPDPSRNEPATLSHIAKTVARCMDVELPRLAAATTENACRFFRLPPTA